MWTGHARFHVVWQIISQCLFSGFAGWLAWHRGPGVDANFYWATAILAIPLFGFLAATIMRSGYGGALFDPNGIPPVPVTIFGKRREVDVNLVVVVVGLLVLAGIVMVYGW